LDQPPNFENKHWHLIVSQAPADPKLLQSARAKLFAAREKRVRPGRDDKVLTSWNALMIAGMARAARVLGKPEWLASARKALDFIRREMWRDGKLLATAKDGRAHLDAYLDDHAYLLAALIEVMQADFAARDLAWAREIADVLLDDFRDDVNGGFFFTSHDHEQLIHRPKPGPDNATPSGNAVAALSLNRLSFLTGEPRYAEAARGTLSLFWPSIERQAAAFGTMLAALEEQVTPPRTIIVTGPRGATAPWHDLLDRAYLPTTIVLFIDSIEGLPEAIAKPLGARVNAYVCEGVTCLPPIESPEELRAALDLPTIAPSPATNNTGAPQ